MKQKLKVLATLAALGSISLLAITRNREPRVEIPILIDRIEIGYPDGTRSVIANGTNGGMTLDDFAKFTVGIASGLKDGTNK